jgi:pantothenate kinase type III
LGALHAFPGKSILVVSFGSALVMDRISSKGVLEGGLIGLGREAYARAMAGIRSCLVPAEPGADYPGKNTSQAVALGWDEPNRQLLKAHARSVDEMIFTGGGAGAWKGIFSEAHVMPWLGQDAMAKALGYWSTKKAEAPG